MNKENQKRVRKEVKDLDSDIVYELLGDLYIAAIDREMNMPRSIFAMDDCLTRLFRVRDFE